MTLACLLFNAGVAGAASQTQLGLVSAGQNMFTYVGQVQQNGPLSVDAGYLTSLAGLDESQLFSGGDPLARTEKEARFTYFANATLLTRSVNGNVFITGGTAETTLYFKEGGGASFDDPASFKQGAAVATYESVWQDLVNVQAPNQGVVTAVSDETQQSATPFTLGGTEYVIGRQGLRFRLSFTGEGNRTEPTAPAATILYGGNAVPVAQEGLPAAVSSGGRTSNGWAIGAAILALIAFISAAGALVLVRRRRTSPG